MKSEEKTSRVMVAGSIKMVIYIHLRSTDVLNEVTTPNSKDCDLNERLLCIFTNTLLCEIIIRKCQHKYVEIYADKVIICIDSKQT